MKKITMIKESFVIDDDTNALMIAWPDMYREKIFWHDLLKIYYEIINIIISNGYFITLVHHKGANIAHDLDEVDRKLSNINNKFISLYEYNYDDIWIRDYGPKTIKSGLSKFNFNGYGNKYFHQNDKVFYNDFIKKYSINHKDLFSEIVMEGGNVINSARDYIFNKNPIVMHNSLPWSDIKEKIKLLFDESIDGDCYFIDIKPLTGDDTNGHIDNFVRFQNNKHILYMSTDDANHPDYGNLKKLENELKILITKTNNISLMTPINHTCDDIVRSKNGDILPFSYLNFIRVGNVIIFPINLNTSSKDKKNIKILFPNKNIYFIESSALLNEFGGLHCCSNNFIK
ncbi:MAG: agmatine deiminase [Gammaproteobacteria bacterium]|jgi:agmatine deiminase|tara:strand:+ start:2171 stop:3199 length:1029 start_codon:yes stop_codon:yes gene_type:complete